jgi:hypothetical protein
MYVFAMKEPSCLSAMALHDNFSVYCPEGAHKEARQVEHRHLWLLRILAMALFPVRNQPSWIAALRNPPVKHLLESEILLCAPPKRLSSHQSLLFQILIDLFGWLTTSLYGRIAHFEQGEKG